MIECTTLFNLEGTKFDIYVGEGFYRLVIDRVSLCLDFGKFTIASSTEYDDHYIYGDGFELRINPAIFDYFLSEGVEISAFV